MRVENKLVNVTGFNIADNYYSSFYYDTNITVENYPYNKFLWKTVNTDSDSIPGFDLGI